MDCCLGRSVATVVRGHRVASLGCLLKIHELDGTNTSSESSVVLGVVGEDGHGWLEGIVRGSEEPVPRLPVEAESQRAVRGWLAVELGLRPGLDS